MKINFRKQFTTVSLLTSLAILSGCGASAVGSMQSTSAPAPATRSATAAPQLPQSTTTLPTQVPVAAASATVVPQTTAPAAATEQPLAPEQNPVGDIPDNQAFVTYTSSGGYALDVPEGWARTEQGGDVRFVSKFNGVQVSITPASDAPTAKSAPNVEIPAFVAAGRAVTVSGVRDVTLPGGAAVEIVSTANSAPDEVTNKQVRLEQNTYLFFNNGKLATLTMEAPQGADNVDQWKRMAESFRWQ